MNQENMTAGGAHRPCESAPKNTPEPAETPHDMPLLSKDSAAQTHASQPEPPAPDAPADSAAIAPPAPGAAKMPAYAVPSPRPDPAKQFGFTPVDIAAALVFFAVGWMFWEWQLWEYSPLPVNGTALFTVFYTAVVLGYVYLSGLRPPRESWFWLAVLLGLGLAWALPYGGELLGVLHYGALLLTASYWTLCATGRLMKQGQTSNWLAFDLVNALIILPWGNFLRLPAALADGVKQLLARRRAGREKRDAQRAWAILGGVAAAALCLCAVLPSLMAADDGFDALMRSLGGTLFHWHISGEFFVKLFFALPTSLFLYGLAYGAVRGRRLDLYEKREICSAQAGLRFAPRTTVLTALLALCAVYLLFLSLQAKYLFGAFWGALPEGFTYAAYARQGFFELCRVAAINIAILILANVLSREQAGQSRPLRFCNIALSALTLLLLVTAASKMALYIIMMGLTVKRVLVSVFLVWMALVFLCVILRQFRPVPLVRIAVFAGALLFTLLCVLPVEDGIASYNAAHGHTEQTVFAEIFTVVNDDYAALVWQGRVYVPYCPVDNSALGRCIGGAAGGDVQEEYYTYRDYPETEWLIAVPRSGLMDAPMLMREENNWDIPGGLTSEYWWNQEENREGIRND